tara:strand:+ start:8595 stop:9614 length:1020 start_codon:yes stop_codon:yes gene_type:complete
MHKYLGVEPLSRWLGKESVIVNKLIHYGIGRLIIERTKFWSALFPLVVKGLRLTKIALGIFGYLHRKRIAVQISKDSPYRNTISADIGFAILPPGTFDAVDQIIPVAKSIYKDHLYRLGCHKADSGYSLLLSSSTVKNRKCQRTDLRYHPQFQALAAYRPFVEIASAYLGELPILGFIDLELILPVADGNYADIGEDLGARAFHIDVGGSAGKQVKCFIPVEDVDEGNGATIVMNAKTSRQLAQATHYSGGRISDNIVFSDPWRQHLVHTSCPAGSVIFMDTFGMVHCGGRTTTRPRIMIILQYTSKYVAAETELQRNRFEFDKHLAMANPISRQLFDL